MNAYRTRLIDPTKILTRRELAIVLAELKRKAERSPGTWLNLIIFRLAACCGLRVSELASLRLTDVRVEVSRPHLVVRRGAAKGGRSRTVPLWWDAGTLSDLAAWNKVPNRTTSTSPRRDVDPRADGYHATRFANGSERRANRSAPHALNPSPSTTGATRSSAMPWPADGRWRKFGTVSDMGTFL
jgi:integrase